MEYGTDWPKIVSLDLKSYGVDVVTKVEVSRTQEDNTLLWRDEDRFQVGKGVSMYLWTRKLE